MNILFLNQTLLKDDEKNNRGKFNPSNNNFYSLLEDSIKLKSNVISISLPPVQVNKNRKYVYRCKTFITRLMFQHLFLKIKIKKIKFDTVLIDSSNYHLCKIGHYLKNKGHKVGLVVTDNPYNISNVPSFYAKKMVNLYKGFDFYITLTEKLFELCETKAPHEVIYGINKTTKIKAFNKNNKPYIYFGGSLYKKYGVQNLIDAYLKSDIKNTYALYLAGGGPILKNMKKYSDTTIYCLGSLTKEDNIMFQKGASFLINPRPLNKELDEYSIPSKTIEYSFSNQPIISCKHPLLFNLFNDSIIWTNDTTEELTKTLDSLPSIPKEKLNYLKQKSFEIALKNCDIAVISNKINYLF